MEKCLEALHAYVDGMTYRDVGLHVGGIRGEPVSRERARQMCWRAIRWLRRHRDDSPGLALAIEKTDRNLVEPGGEPVGYMRALRSEMNS